MLHRVNRILTRAVLILLSIVLITTSVVSQIFAKYTQTRSIMMTLGFKPGYVEINWESLYNAGLMRSQWWTDIGQSKNDYNSKFTVTPTENSITSVHNDEGADVEWANATWPDRSYFSTKMYDITPDTKYEYTFEAKNDRAGGYAGVIFAYDITKKLPYFAYGKFDNRSDEGTNHIYYRKGHSDEKNYDCVVNKGDLFNVKVNETDGYGQYKVIYEGLNVKFCYRDTSGEYVQLGNPITLPEGSKVCVGVYSPVIKDIDNKWCTVSLRNCVLTAKNYKTVGYLEGKIISFVKKFTLKVATFNINWPEGDPDYTKIAAAIKASGADIIALQEVWYMTSNSDWKDQAAEIARCVGYPGFWTFKAMEWNENENEYEKADYEDKDSPKAGYGVAIISRYPLGDLERVALTPGTGESRILARVGIVVENEVLQFFVTQLSYNGEPGTNRAEQFAAVANEIAQWDNVILMGDFNTVNTEDLSQFKPIVEKGFSLVNKPDDPIGTYRHTGAPLDNIVHSKIFTASDRDVIDNNASDHYLLYTTLTFDETPPTDDEATLTDDE